MTCKQVESVLMDYMDGKLPDRQRLEVERHTQTCASCGERVSGFTDVFNLLDSWEGITPSPYFDARLEQRIKAEAESNGWWSNLFPRLVPLPTGNSVFALAFLIVITVATAVLRYSPTAPATIAQGPPPVSAAPLTSDVDELNLYRNLPVLEDLDVLRNFEVLEVLDGESQ
jgi:anti-sigma factor RsiW